MEVNAGLDAAVDLNNYCNHGEHSELKAVFTWQLPSPFR
jgi:hypothetical protein